MKQLHLMPIFLIISLLIPISYFIFLYVRLKKENTSCIIQDIPFFRNNFSTFVEQLKVT